MRPNYIKHPDMLALVFCTPERYTETWAHMLWLQCTPVTRSICIIRCHNHQPHTQQVSPSCACIVVLHN